MSSLRSTAAYLAATTTIAALAACGQEPPTENARSQRRRSAEIVQGGPASAFPEAVLVDVLKGGAVTSACSGVLLAPSVVLTAGHCVADSASWKVSAPNAGGQSSTASAAASQYQSLGKFVNPASLDVALIFLDSPITLDAFPTLATSRIADGTKIVNVGRVGEKRISSNELFVSPPLSAQDATRIGFPNYYAALDVLEKGDSGGPVFEVGTHTLVAINAGGGDGVAVHARVDGLGSFIDTQVAAHAAGRGTPSSPTAGVCADGTCSHGACDIGAALKATCNACAQTVCGVDAYCCSTEWDIICVAESTSLCGCCGGREALGAGGAAQAGNGTGSGGTSSSGGASSSPTGL